MVENEELLLSAVLSGHLKKLQLFALPHGFHRSDREEDTWPWLDVCQAGHPADSEATESPSARRASSRRSPRGRLPTPQYVGREGEKKAVGNCPVRRKLGSVKQIASALTDDSLRLKFCI